MAQLGSVSIACVFLVAHAVPESCCKNGDIGRSYLRSLARTRQTRDVRRQRKRWQKTMGVCVCMRCSPGIVVA